MSKFTKLINNPKQFFIDSKLVKNFVINNTTSQSTSISKEETVTLRETEEKLLNLYGCDLSIEEEGYVYIPWIKSHGDKLVGQISAFIDTPLHPLWINKELHTPDIRRNISRSVASNPEFFKRIVFSVLARNRKKITALILTLDWPPVMRIIANCCKELDIKTILIPHEGVFADINKYYLDIKTGVNTPICDQVLCWGEQQRDVFLSRGYPSTRLKVVGSPKLDYYTNFIPDLEQQYFYKIFGLEEVIPTILFVCQPLDSQYEVKVARDTQREIINDLIEYVTRNKLQLIIRKPPSGDIVLDEEINKKISEHFNIKVDRFPNYFVSPEEAVFHCDVVLSINSTMLLEALLSKTPSISTKYIKFEQQWKNLNIPAPKNKSELFSELDEVINQQDKYWQRISLDWAKSQLSCGEFGKALSNIRNVLDNSLDFPILFSYLNCFHDKSLSNKRLNVSLNNKLNSSNSYLPQILRAKSISPYLIEDKKLIPDVLINWGISHTINKEIQKQGSKDLSLPLMIIEDGFIRSKNIGLSGEPGLSIICDTKTAYYDARNASYLEDLLNSNQELTIKQKNRAKNIIDMIIENRLSKYNHAPDIALSIGSPERKKILIVDQRFGDMSVEAGLAGPQSFKDMLCDAINNFPSYDILIKRHPDATSGGKQSYFGDNSIGFTKDIPNVYLIDYDINPHVLFDMVDEVFCVTSGMGFEALLRGKKVHCYGLPFYAGWGQTEDKIKISRRIKERSITEIFHFSYIICSLYINPKSELAGEIEDVIQYLSE